MSEDMMPQNKENIDAIPSDSSVYVKVNQNNCVRKAAQRYLDLCNGLDNGILQQNLETEKVYLPADLMAVEQGVAVLCNAYDCAAKAKKDNVCADIKTELKKVSGFYQEKMTDAYFQASNILLDAEKYDKKLVQSCDSLRKIYSIWPTDENKSDLLSFFEKVDMYGQYFDLENTASAKKIKRTNKKPDWQMNFSSHQRGM